MKNFTKFAVYLAALGFFALSASAQDKISTVIGGGPNGIPGVNANLYNPYQVAVDASGNIYVAAESQHRVFKISTGGTVTVVAGNGYAGYSGDNGPAAAANLNNPQGVAVDAATPLPNVYIADYSNCLIRKVNQSTGVITTIGGLVTHPTTGNPYSTCGYAGNGAKAELALLNGPTNLAVNPTTSDVYFTDFNNGVVRKIAGGVGFGTISLVAGSGGSTSSGQNCGGTSPYGNGASATAAYLCYPQGIAVDTSTSTTKPNIFISEYNGNRCDIREVVGSSNDIYGVAGSPTLGCGFTDNVVATSGQLSDPWQMHVSVSSGKTTVEVADYNNARIRQFTLTYSGAVPKPGTITTIGGKGQGGFCNDAGPVLNACMNPVGLAYDASGNYYIGDYGADRVRKVSKSTGDINTIDGWGPNGGTNVTYSNPVGLKGVSGTPSLYNPLGVFADPGSSNVYVGGYSGQAVYVWNSSSNEFSDFAGNGVAGFDGDGGAANNAATELNSPIGLGKDSAGNIYIADNNNCAIREVEASNGNITTVAGGTPGALKGCGYGGDGSPAVTAQFNAPNSLAFDGGGNMYIADYNNCAIRKIAAGSHTVSTIAGGSQNTLLGCGYTGDGGPATKAKISGPQGISADSHGNIYFSDRNNNRIRWISSGGIIQTIAGYFNGGYTGDGPATANSLAAPGFTSNDGNGNVFFSDTNNHILRWVTPTGTMITFAGTPQTAGFSGDGGAALSADLYYPAGISRDSKGNTYVADESNYRVRQITPFAGYGLSTSALSFETQPSGTTSDFQPVLVSAIGPTTFSSVTASTGFSEIDDCAGVTLQAGQTCEVDVYYSPTTPGKSTGTLTFGSNAFFALNPKTIALSGTGGGITVTGSLAFPTELIGSKTTQTITLKTGAALTIKSIAFSTVGNFSITGGTCPASGGSLSAGGSCTITVTFDPTSIGTKKNTLVLTSNDPASPLLIQATGTGSSAKVSPTSINFTTIKHGTNETSNVSITNLGTAALSLSTAFSGSGAGEFSVNSTGNTCGKSVAAGATCTLPIKFAPAAAASYTATLTLTTNGDNNPTVALSGTGS